MAVKRRQGPQIPEMNDNQLLAHLLHMAGSDLTSARELSHSMLDTYQDLAHVLALPRKKLLRYPGLGENEAAFLLLLPALMHRYTTGRSQRPVELVDQKELERLLLPHFYGQSVERVCAFCLDGELRLLTAALAAQGGPVAVSCSVRRVMELALSHHAKGVFLAHNHPDGSPLFSKSDLLSTWVLSQELAMVDIPLLDHFLLAGDQIISLRQYSIQQRALGIPLPFPMPEGWFPGQ